MEEKQLLISTFFLLLQNTCTGWFRACTDLFHPVTWYSNSRKMLHSIGVHLLRNFQRGCSLNKGISVRPVTFILFEFLASYFVKRFGCWGFLFFWYFTVWNPFLLLQRSPSCQLNVTENSSGGPNPELGAHSAKAKHMWEPFQLWSSSLQVRLWSHICSLLLIWLDPKGKIRLEICENQKPTRWSVQYTGKKGAGAAFSVSDSYFCTLLQFPTCSALESTLR